MYFHVIADACRFLNRTQLIYEYIKRPYSSVYCLLSQSDTLNGFSDFRFLPLLLPENLVTGDALD